MSKNNVGYRKPIIKSVNTIKPGDTITVSSTGKVKRIINIFYIQLYTYHQLPRVLALYYLLFS